MADTQKQEAEEKETKKESKGSGKVQKLIEEIETLSVLELSDLVKALEDKFGPAQVMVAPSAAVAGNGGAAAAPAEAGEEQTTFNVVLTGAGANKISVIKAVREINQTLGLKEAKDLVEAAPKEVLNAVNKATAQEAKKKLETAGATVELK
ncbi:MAG: 50S ribosomal protein L7/L12 [bacterium]|nr:50S ribosomal protein L7/L12 [bacterium]